ncbi:MAG: RnfABCDGE type electron transport complex subunit G [Candidatus Omnitrophica bacterium]|nr:RnfABCDGE type electron transport complex subunit G [Candidatus Omnitrophota bacterium]MBU4479276.1 RnfABCDGE type electron transport complex subunit G [Candidatus Omnitrophota bacterium]MCG2703257.1 RnfABCDGE type electron transport complex subunit G [Candidatus Omnitrophota bacterium]
MIRLSGTLFAVALVCAVILAFVFQQTAPIIAEQKQMLFERSCREVLKADRYQQNEKLPACYNAFDENGNFVGWCVKAQAKGYGGKMDLLVGVDSQGMVTAVKVLEHKETPGLGSRMSEPAFIDRFKQKNIEDIVLVKGKTDKNIQAITGATISSRAVVDAVRSDVSALLEKIKEQ